MKAQKGPLLQLRRGWVLLRSRWRDVLFTLLVAAGLVLYLARPERAAQWADAARWWGGFLHDWGLDQSAARFEGEPVLRPPVDYSQSRLAALATFGGDLDYLGADTAVTWGQDGAAHLWLRTYWRCPAAGCNYRIRYTWGRSGPGMVVATHDLARRGLRTPDKVVDHLLLPPAAVEGAIAVQVAAEGGVLPVRSPVLQVGEGGRLYVWER